MLSSEQILENTARDGTIDIAEWPRVLETLLQRLNDIVHNEFPLPPIPLPAPLPPPTIDPEVVASTPPHALTSDPASKDEDLADAGENDPPPNSQSSTKENDVPMDIAAARTSAPAFQANHVAHDDPVDSVDPEPGALPPDLLSLYTSSTRILENDFAHSPPYTIQRLAELALHPKRHYRFLPAYLRALDRIVSVSSPTSDFPLPALQAAYTTAGASFLTNGDTSQVNGIASDKDLLGSDESLGGALLTPIPWLRNNAVGTATTASSAGSSHGEGELHSESTETIEGPNGPGGIETVTVTVNGVTSASSAAHSTSNVAPASPTLSEQSDASSSGSSGTMEAQMREQGAVTQGELLRQEQEAGVVPLNQTSPRRNLLTGGTIAVGRESHTTPNSTITPGRADEMDDRVVEEHELPHARGPEEIGLEDTGPQHDPMTGGLDLEAAVGRGRSKSPQPPPSMETIAESEAASIAEVVAEAAKEDDSGAPGKNPKDVEMEVEKLKEAMDSETVEEAKLDRDGDVVVADADGRPVDEKEEREVTGDLGGPDSVDTTTL